MLQEETSIETTTIVAIKRKDFFIQQAPILFGGILIPPPKIHQNIEDTGENIPMDGWGYSDPSTGKLCGAVQVPAI